MGNTPSGDIHIHKIEYRRRPYGLREVIVYLPPGYDAAPRVRYPVLYLHDGQNLFDPATAFLGNHWRLKEVADELIHRGEIQPLIIAGVYNAREHRIDEYTPVRDSRGYGGKAGVYGNLVLKKIRSYIDNAYRTLSDGMNTGLGGSSLGGLVTLHLGLRHPRTFQKLIVMSPSVWWAGRAILQEIEKVRRKPQLKIWLDIGTREGPNPKEHVRDVADLRDALTRKGWRLGHDLSYVEDEGAGHDEKAWGLRMRGALKFLFPPAVLNEELVHARGPGNRNLQR